jgi:2-polyprenyl-3-methyl-5-hydroxy-6-metoxy-1,4-benzoquinol methylase
MTVSDAMEQSNAGTGFADKSDCLVCDGTYGSSRLPGLKQCTSCGFITADLAISDEALASLYGKDYFHGDEYRNYVSEEGSLKANFRRRIETLTEIVAGLQGKRLFEIGCAYGFFLDEVRGDVLSAQGIDIVEDGTRFARDVKHVDAITGNYLEFKPDGQVDVITMWDTIEHLPRPDLFIEKAADHVSPGGYIALTTGNISSLNARLRGRHWRMIHPPTHLHYFSVSTLSRLLETRGFEVLHVSHPGNARDLRSVLHFILDLRLGWSGLYQRIASWRIFDLSLTLNLFDIMFIVARRRDA